MDYKKMLAAAAAAAALLSMAGCSDRTSKEHYEEVCVEQMMKGNPKGMDEKQAKALMREICHCSVPAYEKMSDTSKEEFIAMIESSRDGNLTNEQDGYNMMQALGQCTVMTFGRMMGAARKQQ